VPVSLPDLLVTGPFVGVGILGAYYVLFAERIEKRRSARAVGKPAMPEDSVYDPGKLAPEPRTMGFMLLLLCLIGIVARLI
jgi:hypothetical protein